MGLTVGVDELVEEAKGTLAGLQTSIVHDGEDTCHHRAGSRCASNTYIHTHTEREITRAHNTSTSRDGTLTSEVSILVGDAVGIGLSAQGSNIGVSTAWLKMVS